MTAMVDEYLAAVALTRAVSSPVLPSQAYAGSAVDYNYLRSYIVE